jgi:hypothetical protein
MPAKVDFNALLANPEESFLPYLQSALIFKGEGLEPELFRFVGREKLREFLVAFGGQTVTFPSWEAIASSIRDGYVLWRWDQIKRGDYRMSQLCQDLGLNETQIKYKVEALQSVHSLLHGRSSTS